MKGYSSQVTWLYCASPVKASKAEGTCTTSFILESGFSNANDSFHTSMDLETNDLIEMMLYVQRVLKSFCSGMCILFLCQGLLSSAKRVHSACNENE